MIAIDGATAHQAPAEPSDSPGFLLWRTTLRWQRSITAALRPLELTHVQFVLLAGTWWLSDTPGIEARSPTQRQLAAHAQVDAMMTSQVLRVLEGRGLIHRAVDPADARVKRVTVTDVGRSLAEQAIAVVEKVGNDFFSNARDLRQVVEVLRQLDR